MKKFAEVIVDVDASEIDRVFDYSIPSFMELTAGERVLVPFGPRKLEGFVISIKNSTDYDETKVKDVIKKLDDFTAIKPEMLNLLGYMTSEFHLRIAPVLRLFIPSGMRDGKVKEIIEKYVYKTNMFNVADLSVRKNAVKYQALIEYMQTHDGVKISILNTQFTQGAVKKLIDKGFVEVRESKKERSPLFLKKGENNHTMTYEQNRAIDAVKFGESETYLLHGVTGSGKTEVYMHLIAKAIKDGKTAIMLVPEISLTPQVLSTFKTRFGEQVAILHSGLSQGERYDEWCRLEQGIAKIAVGARSAIFAPLQNLGIIIIDEEHDQSYFSESNPRYATEDVAKFRSVFNSCPLVLGSATPSIVSYEKAMNGEWKLLQLPDRINGKPLPKVQIVDMQTEIRRGGNLMFSSPLLNALKECINSEKQAMLFLNRRGFSSFLMCKECGYIAKCEDCDVSLVYHRDEEILKCHYCGKKYHVLDVCPNCKSPYIKHGAVGTQKIVQELKNYFPGVKILRMDNDTTRTKDGHLKILKEFGETKPAILVGTQMIAKGHDFPDVTVVGILDADQSLFHSDYRSSEKTFALITQVSGRAGRSESEGKVYLQTFCPKHYVYRFVANYDYEGYYKKEINIRQTTQFPPYSKIVKVLLTSENEENVREITKMCYNKLCEVKERYADEFIYFDVMKPPISRIQNKFRYQILMRFFPKKSKEITNKIFEIVDECKTSKTTVFVEINPQSIV